MLICLVFKILSITPLRSSPTSTRPQRQWLIQAPSIRPRRSSMNFLFPLDTTTEVVPEFLLCPDSTSEVVPVFPDGPYKTTEGREASIELSACFILDRETVLNSWVSAKEATIKDSDCLATDMAPENGHGDIVELSACSDTATEANPNFSVFFAPVLPDPQTNLTCPRGLLLCSGGPQLRFGILQPRQLHRGPPDLSSLAPQKHC